MAHFAKIVDDVVVNVHSFPDDTQEQQEMIAAYGGTWVQSSATLCGSSEWTAPIHKNHAVIGYTYDAIRCAFIPPKPYPSWILNEATCQWEPPIPYP